MSSGIVALKRRVFRRAEVPKKARLYWVWEEHVSFAYCEKHHPKPCPTECYEIKQIASPAYK